MKRELFTYPKGDRFEAEWRAERDRRTRERRDADPPDPVAAYLASLRTDAMKCQQAARRSS
jgi:hypothetical protein